MGVDYEFLRWIAAIFGVIGTAMIAWGGTRRLTAAGFFVVCVCSVAWMGVGVLQGANALTTQNLVLLAINGVGVWRWGRPLGPDDQGLAPEWRAFKRRSAALGSRLWTRIREARS